MDIMGIENFDNLVEKEEFDEEDPKFIPHLEDDCLLRAHWEDKVETWMFVEDVIEYVGYPPPSEESEKQPESTPLEKLKSRHRHLVSGEIYKKSSSWRYNRSSNKQRKRKVSERVERERPPFPGPSKSKRRGAKSVPATKKRSSSPRCHNWSPDPESIASIQPRRRAKSVPVARKPSSSSLWSSNQQTNKTALFQRPLYDDDSALPPPIPIPNYVKMDIATFLIQPQANGDPAPTPKVTYGKTMALPVPPPPPIVITKQNWMEHDPRIKFARAHCKMKDEPTVKLTTIRLSIEKGTPPIKFIRMMDFWPEAGVKFLEEPIFELLSQVDKFRKMQQAMYDLYYTRLHNSVVFPFTRLKVDYYVVYNHWSDDYKLSYHRAKVLHVPKRPTGGVNLELIDQGTRITAEASQILFLFEQFADKPPRAHMLELEGLKFYKGSGPYKGLMSPLSGLWDDTLLVTKCTDFGVVIHSRLTRSFDYGINEFIIRRLQHELPPPYPTKVGDVREGHIVFGTKNGDLLVQFQSPFLRHQIHLLEQYAKFPMPPQVAQSTKWKKGMLVFAQYEGAPFRALIKKVLKNELIVFFIDEGDEAQVKASEVMTAKSVHPLLDVLPPLATTVRLVNGVCRNRDSPKTFGPLWQFLEDFALEEEFVNLETMEIDSDKTPLVKLVHNLPKTEEDAEQLCAEFEGSSNIHEIRKRDNKPIPSPSNPLLMGLNSIRFDVLYSFKSFKSQEECLYFRKNELIRFQIHSFMDPFWSAENKYSLYVMPLRLVPRLRKLEEHLDYIFTTASFRMPFGIKNEYWRRGLCFLVQSGKLDRVVRGIFLQPTDITVSNVHAEVLLVDYGIVEQVQWKSLRVMAFDECQLFACGLKARLIVDGKFIEIEEVEKRWGLDCMIVGKVSKVQIQKFGSTVGDIEVQEFVKKPKRRTGYETEAEKSETLEEDDDLYL